MGWIPTQTRFPFFYLVQYTIYIWEGNPPDSGWGDAIQVGRMYNRINFLVLRAIWGLKQIEIFKALRNWDVDVTGD